MICMQAWMQTEYESKSSCCQERGSEVNVNCSSDLDRQQVQQRSTVFSFVDDRTARRHGSSCKWSRTMKWSSLGGSDL
jgi:hypothetical protein